MKRKPKFDNTICYSCKWFYSNEVSAGRSCHKIDRTIYYGECIEYSEIEESPTDTELLYRDVEQYELDWN